MDRALLDTDTLSEVMKRKDIDVIERARTYLEHHGRFTISAVTVFEVVSGFQKRTGLEPDGSVRWARAFGGRWGYGGPGAQGRDGTGAPVVAGSFRGTLALDTGSITSADSSIDVFVEAFP